MNTIEYYNQYAQEYIDRTSTADMEPMRRRFLSHLPPHSTILDVGCGSARDSLAFTSLGHKVLAIDASEEMIRHVSQHNIPCRLMRMEEIDYLAEFDGIWCSASLLHIPKEDLQHTISVLEQALKPGGICFFSFKLGEGEQFENGRYFHYLTEVEFRNLCTPFEILDFWSYPAEYSLQPATWMNAVVRKKCNDSDSKSTGPGRSLDI